LKTEEGKKQAGLRPRIGEEGGEEKRKKGEAGATAGSLPYPLKSSKAPNEDGGRKGEKRKGCIDTRATFVDFFLRLR